jgi:hypothetical protein
MAYVCRKIWPKLTLKKPVRCAAGCSSRNIYHEKTTGTRPIGAIIGLTAAEVVAVVTQAWIQPSLSLRVCAYLEAAGHGADIDGPLFRPLRHNGKRRDEGRGMDPDAIDRVVRKLAAKLGLDRGYSMRAKFIGT